MTRPSNYDDLAAYQRDGHHVASMNADMLVRFPSLGRHLLAALDEAKKLGLAVANDGRISLDRTAAELDEQLAAAQRRWDDDQARYDAALADQSSADQPWKRTAIRQHAEAEGLPLILWTESVA